MSQQSEECLPESTSTSPDGAQGARILHLKSTPYDLQRAIQQRAQESVEREADLDREERRPKPLKWLVIFAIACIPMALTLVMVDGFLRAFHKYLGVTSQQQQQQQQAESESAGATSETLQSSDSGVVILQPMNIPESAAEQRSAGDSAAAESATAPQRN